MQTVQLLWCVLAAALTVQAARAQEDDCPPTLMSPACDYYGRWSRGGTAMVTGQPSKRSRRQLIDMLLEIALQQKAEAVNRVAEAMRQAASRSLRERLNPKNALTD